MRTETARTAAAIVCSPFIRRFTRALACIFLFATAALPAAEPWADERLAPPAGLELWLDASRQNAARGTLGLPNVFSGFFADYLFDGSGHARHLAQSRQEQRPVFNQNITGMTLRFDGKDDALEAALLRTKLTNATVFLVARPVSNKGRFRGPFASAQAGRNDYQTGLNLDFGGGATPGMTFVNSEGAGFGGERQLLGDASGPFKQWRLFSLSVGTGKDAVRLFVSGQPQLARDRQPATLHLDAFALGARIYSNDTEPPHTDGFFEGDIAELLLFNRVLPDAERRTVEKYLSAKYAALLDATPGAEDGVEPLVVVTNAPPVQMLVPGFEVRELPLVLNNVNNLRYRPDGKLLASLYNGQLWLLSDTDGDGLEDKAEPFWTNSVIRAPIGFALTPPGFARGEGAVVPSVGKLSLILDTNRDGRADVEEILASGWPATKVTVDATCTAFAPDGSLYFGLGCADYANGYQLDKATGASAYDIKSQRGTVQKFSPDLKTRETVCTGIRWPIGMAFNRHGDLFLTDQEGATWLPNGNPFDELLHIQPGRHYGFPPRHPRHLPNVMDEPSVFDYGPQHQSTCGMVFNEPPFQRAAGVPPAVPSSATGQNFRRDAGSTLFGPSWWAGDAFVTGESRGKLYRTKLVKTAVGYVAHNEIIACLRELAIDVTLSPRGDLLVCTHSGKPDWGTGPTGKGHIYRIRYADTNAAQPVLSWSASATEIKIAFDRPLDPAALKDLSKRARVTQGKYAMPGDRFETIWPGYQVVHEQRAQPRVNVPVLAANLSADRRTLSLVTKPRTEPVNYAVRIPNVSRRSERDDIELLVTLNGLAAEWRSEDGKENWTGWLPHADLAVSRALTTGSAEHERLQAALQRPGKLTLKTQLDLWQMLQPALQAGAKLDYVPEPENISADFSGDTALAFTHGEGKSVPWRSIWQSTVHSLHVKAVGERWQRVEFSVPTGGDKAWLHTAWRSAASSESRAFALRRFLLPHAAQHSASAVAIAPKTLPPEIVGGNWLRGRRLFHGEQAACARCHTMQNLGGLVGPDLSNLIHRDYASVMKDLLEPSAALNPDHLAYVLELADGESVTGVLLGDSANEYRLADATGKVTALPRAKVKSLKPAALSLMPEGLLAPLKPEEVRDLMFFLLTEPPLSPAPIEGKTPPPPSRKRAELEAVLQSAAAKFSKSEITNLKFHILLCDGPKDHGKDEHDYPLWKRRWATLLALADGVTVDTAHIWPSAEQFARADVICFFNSNPGWSEARGTELDAYLARGGGAVYFHWACEARTNAHAFARRIGLASDSRQTKYRHGPLDLVLKDHPLLRGFTAASFARTNFVDESYWNLVGDLSASTLLADSMEDGALRPQIWTREAGRGRVFVSIPGHYNWSFDDPLYRVLAFRGLCWAARQPLDRLAELAPVGARIAE